MDLDSGNPPNCSIVLLCNACMRCACYVHIVSDERIVNLGVTQNRTMSTCLQTVTKHYAIKLSSGHGYRYRLPSLCRACLVDLVLLLLLTPPSFSLPFIRRRCSFLRFKISLYSLSRYSSIEICTAGHTLQVLLSR